MHWGTPFAIYIPNLVRYLDGDGNWIRNNVPWWQNSTSGSNFNTSSATFIRVIIQNLSQMTQTYDCSLDPFTSPSSPLLSQWVKCWRRNTQNGVTVPPIANLMAYSKSGCTVSYSSFLVTIHLSFFVSEIFVCDSQTDGPANNNTVIITHLDFRFQYAAHR